MLQRISLGHPAGGAPDHERKARAELQRIDPGRQRDRVAVAGVRVARLDVEDRRLRRRLQRWLVHRVAERFQRAAEVQQRAVDRAARGIH